ncbi:hypothetical protein HZH66_000890 [Vespula vulgaris]|uniref:Uncharacterized protein n=1 Tax=Vespula vulgaris TaxID=7454 RepID=A0A834NL85_VESVU|nr:hypothetical protein HZH66_000890 [Vespula vulgaris]
MKVSGMERFRTFRESVSELKKKSPGAAHAIRTAEHIENVRTTIQVSRCSARRHVDALQILNRSLHRILHKDLNFPFIQNDCRSNNALNGITEKTLQNIRFCLYDILFRSNALSLVNSLVINTMCMHHLSVHRYTHTKSRKVNSHVRSFTANCDTNNWNIYGTLLETFEKDEVIFRNSRQSFRPYEDFVIKELSENIVWEQ